MEEVIRIYNENFIKLHGISKVQGDWVKMIRKILEVLGPPVNPVGNLKVSLDQAMEKEEKLVRFILDSWISGKQGRYWRKELYQIIRSGGLSGYFDVIEYKLHILEKEELLQSISGSEAYQFRKEIDELFESPEYKLLSSLSGLKATHIW